MAGFCRKCGSAFDKGQLCAHCGSPVGPDGSVRAPYSLPTSLIDDRADGTTFLRRLGLGIVAIIGLYYGLLHLTLGIALTTSGANSLTVEGSLGLLVAATLAGAAAAGTVNRQAEIAGLILGIGAAAGFIALETRDGRLPLDEGWFAIATSLALVGVVGAVAGRLMIPPAPQLPTLVQFDGRKMEVAYRPRVPVIWWRILPGVLLVVLGTIYADNIRFLLARVFAGHSVSGSLGRMVSWQVSVIAAIVGGIVAGANTRSGIKQGFIAGLIAAIGVIISLQRDAATPSLILEFWFEQFDVEKVGPEILAAAGGTVWLGVIVGGWLGSHVFPPRRR